MSHCTLPAEPSEESKEGDIIDESEENESFVQKNASFDVIASQTENIVTQNETKEDFDGDWIACAGKFKHIMENFNIAGKDILTSIQDQCVPNVYLRI